MSTAPRSPFVPPSPQPLTAIRTDIFPSQPRPQPPSDAPFEPRLSTSSFESSAKCSVASLRVPVAYDDGDPFAPATVSVSRPRGARTCSTNSLPQEVFDLLRSSPPSGKKRRPRREVARPPSVEVLDEQSAKPSPGFLIKGLTVLKGLSRKPSNLSIADAQSDGSQRRGSPLKSQVARGSPTSSTTSSPRRKLSISSDFDDTPRSWREYTAAYAKGEIDIECPPVPPHSFSSRFPSPNFTPTPQSSPFSEKIYPAPRPANEHNRQRILSRLDLFGTGTNMSGSTFCEKSSSHSPLVSSQDDHFGRPPALPHPYPSRSHSLLASISPDLRVESPEVSSSLLPGHFGSTSTPAATTPHVPPARTMRNDRALLRIVDRCQELFGASTIAISVLQSEQLVFLASAGVPDEVQSLPRSATLDAHAVLNGRVGLVVPDTHDDWRFKKSVLSVVLGIRFYAGVPIFLPEGSGRPGDSSIAIGTLAIMDVKPRRMFTARDRFQLHTLATEVALEIASWVSERAFLPDPSSPASLYALSTQTNHTSPKVLSGSSRVSSPSSGVPRSNLSSSPDELSRDWHSTLRQPIPFPSTPPIISSCTLSADVFQDPRPDSPPSSINLLNSPPLQSWSSASDTPLPLTDLVEASLPSPTSANFTVLPAKPPKSPKLHPVRPPRRAPINSRALPPISTAAAPKSDAYTMPSPVLTAPPTPVVSELSSLSDSNPDRATLPWFLSPPSKALTSVLELSTRTLAARLDLSLCYVLALHLPTSPTSPPSSAYTILALAHTTSYPPSFDTELHLRALVNEEGGLLYRKPAGRSHSPYEAGIILPVAETGDVGICMAGFSTEQGRVLERRDLDVFANVAKQVGRCIVKAGASARAERE